MKRNFLGCACLAIATVSLLAVTEARGAIIYSNDFENPATAFNGLTASGTLLMLTTHLNPTDSGGISSPNQSTWLGQLGQTVVKSNSMPEVVTLSLSGLSPGTQYTVAFDLFIGASWDGSAKFYGPDEWSLTAHSGATNTPLVDATFSNCGPNICGAPSPQTYSNATPLAGTAGPTFAVQTDSAFSFDSSNNYSMDYAIYNFSHGAGPTLSFTAGASTATLVFQRGPGPASLDSSDEFWALDNLTVTGAGGTSAVPEPSSVALLGSGIFILGLLRRRLS